MNPRIKFARIANWLRAQLGDVREVEIKQARVEELVAGAEYELGALRRELGMPPESLSVKSREQVDDSTDTDLVEGLLRGRPRRPKLGQDRRVAAKKKQGAVAPEPRRDAAKSAATSKADQAPAATPLRKRLIDRL